MSDIDPMFARLIEPQWHSLAFLPVLAAAMSDNAKRMREQARRMTTIREQSMRLDRAELMRLERVYGTNASYVEVYREQLRQWRAAGPSVSEREALDQLDRVLEQWHADAQLVVTAVKTLLEERVSATRKSATD